MKPGISWSPSGGARLLCLLFCCATVWAGDLSADPSLTVLNRLAGERGVPRFEEHWADVSGSRLHYVTAGSGPLVVFHHGFPSHWYMWRDQLLDLARDHRVVALDGLGYNRSDKPAERSAYDIGQLASLLRDFAIQVGDGEPYTLVGHDWGGTLTWAVAQAYPQALERIVVVSAPPLNLFLQLLQNDPAQREASRYMARLKALGEEPQLSDEVIERLHAIGYGGLLEQEAITVEESTLFLTALREPAALHAALQWYAANVPAPAAIGPADYWPSAAAAAEVQSLLIWGDNDRAFVEAFITQLPAFAPRLRVERLGDVGHWPPLEAPETVNALLRAFINGDDGRP